MSNKINKWTLITIDDPNFLNNQIFIKIFNLLTKLESYKFAILDDIYAIGDDNLFGILRGYDSQIMRLKDLLYILDDIKNFEWGDFFLFKSYPENWKSCDDEINYPFLIAQSDTTVRAVDNQYVYIYTQSNQIVESLKKEFQIESLKNDVLENFEYPR